MILVAQYIVFVLFVGSGIILVILQKDIFKVRKVLLQQTVEDTPERFASSKNIRARLKKTKREITYKIKIDSYWLWNTWRPNVGITVVLDVVINVYITIIPWARVGYNHFISNKGEWNNCFSKFSNRILPRIFISTILQSVRTENF